MFLAAIDGNCKTEVTEGSTVIAASDVLPGIMAFIASFVTSASANVASGPTNLRAVYEATKVTSVSFVITASKPS